MQRHSEQFAAKPALAPLRRALFTGAVLLGASLSAQAQSSVSLYGLIDDGLRHDSQANGQKATSGPIGAQTLVLSGSVSNSYFGFRGREDLSGGLVAGFDLESGFLSNTGVSQQSSAFFDRRAAVGLGSERFGTLYLGRNTTFAYDQAAAGTLDPLQRAYNNVNESAVSFGSGKSGAIGGLVSARLNASNTVIGSAFATDRNNNMLKYQRSDGPLSAGLSYATGGAAGSSDPHASGGFVNYSASSLALAAATQQNVDAAGHHARLYSVGGYYKLSSVRLQAAYQQLSVDDPYNANTSSPLETVDSTGAVALASSTPGKAGANDRIQVSDMALIFAPKANLSLSAALYHLALSGSAINGGANNTLILLAKYSLSPRSLVYAGLDASRSSGSLHGVNTSGHDVGLSSGVQLKF